MQKLAIIFLVILILYLGFHLIFISKNKLSEKIMDEEDKKIETISKEVGMEKFIITIVYDNYQINSHLNLKEGWGFSCFIKKLINNKKELSILFDTGADSEKLLFNMKKMEINPNEIDYIFISHLHEDHTGGLPGILKIKPNLPIYKPESFSTPKQISDKIWTTGLLGGKIKEQALIIDSKKGIIIVTGCAHPGIISIIEKSKEILNKEVYLVMGGFHLKDASEFELKNIIKDFKRLGVEKVVPCHCSGDKARELFKKEYQDNFIESGVGRMIIF